MMVNIPALHDWQNFYMLTGAAAATLIGLLFVAISIGTNLPMNRVADALQTFVTPTLIYYFQVLVASCLAVTPLQSQFVFGGALAMLGCINIVLALKVFWRIRVIHTNDKIDFGHSIWHFLLPLAVGQLFTATAIGFFLDEPLATICFSITDLLCLTIGLHNTWTLTIWLALRSQQSQLESNSTSQE